MRPELDTLVQLALAAGDVIMAIYERGDVAVEIKADNSPLTEADLAAERLILDGLAQAFPDIPVIAEEAAAAGLVPECGERFFLVDPLDGSKEFLKRNGEFTVNIALVEHGVPVLGVVYAPALKRIWWGALGEGSRCADIVDGTLTDERAIAVRPAPQMGLTLVGSRSHGGDAGDQRLAHLSVAEYAAVGSSLKFCLVAEGRADLYPRFGRTMEWDTAAGDAILRAAGGQVLCADGEALRYGKRNQAAEADFANAGFWAGGAERGIKS